MSEEKEKNIREILQDIQEHLNIPKNLYNEFGKYKYRSCESILAAAKPLLAKHKAILLLNDEMIMLGDRFYVKATASLQKREQVVRCNAFAREAKSKKGMDEAQITGAASSYARKYALNGLFAIDDTKDPDATNKHGKDRKKQPPLKTPDELREIFDGAKDVADLTARWKKHAADISKLQKVDRDDLAFHCKQIREVFEGAESTKEV